MSRKMSSRKTSEKKNFLKIRHKSLRGPAPNASSRQTSSHTSANAPDSNIPCNVVSQSPIGASTSQGIASSSGHSWLQQTAGDQPSYHQELYLVRSDRVGAFERAVAVSLKERIDGLSDDDKTAFQSATDVTEKLSVTARIRLTPSGDILTKLATLLDHQSTSYASTQCYIARKVSVRKHVTMVESMGIPKWKVHEVHRVSNGCTHILGA